MRAPQLAAFRHLIRLELPAAVPDGLGGAGPGWTPSGEVFAAIEPVSARERAFAGRADGVVTHRIWLRGASAATSGMRLVLGERTFAVRAAFDPEERGRLTLCLCEEGGR